MSTINQQFIDYATIVPAAWLNNVNNVVNGFVDPQTYGASPLGVVDATTAIAQASAYAVSNGGTITIAPGNYLIGSSLNINAPVFFQPGAKFTIANTAVITFNSGVHAGIQQIFNITGTGSITVNNAVTSIGYPEWFGAVVGNIAVDCSTAINRCIVAFETTQLQSANYYTTNTILMQIAGRSLIGSFPEFSGGPGGSAILCQSGSNDIMRVGPASYPGSLQNTNSVTNIKLLRTIAPVISSFCSGITVAFTVWTTLKNVLVQDSIYGFHIAGTGDMHTDLCVATRTLPGTGGGTDTFLGFFIDGNFNIGFAGGNASVYLDNSVIGNSVSAALTTGNYQGLQCSGTYGYSDVFIRNFETSALSIGMTFVGNNNGGGFDGQNEDVRIYNPVLDTCLTAGMAFSNTSRYGSIQVVGGYIASSPSAVGPSLIQYTNSNGSITVSDMELLGVYSTAGTIGVSATGSSGIVHRDNNILECTQEAILLNSTTDFYSSDQIRRFNTAGLVPAIQLSNGCSRVVMECGLSGATGAYSQGYSLADSTTTFSEFKCSRLILSAISAAAKINNNGTPVTSGGTFATNNLATGIMN